MEEKILPFQIDGRGYFPADTVSLSILKGNYDQNSIIYGFYNLFSYECYYEDGSIILNVELNWECPKLCRKEIPRLILHKNTSFFLIDFIISCIDEGYYIYITVDSSKIKCYSCYNKIDFAPHPLVIYGYNKIKRIFYMADYVNGMNYVEKQVGYDEIVSADNSLRSHMEVLDPFCGTNESILDIELIKYLRHCNIAIDIEFVRNSINLFLNGKGIDGNKSAIMLN